MMSINSLFEILRRISYNPDRLVGKKGIMKRVWPLREANKLSEVVDEALKHRPQIITKRGVEVAIVFSYGVS